MFRILTPGGRIGISDVVAEDDLSPRERAARGSYVGCIAGALSRSEYVDGLQAVGFVEATVRFTHLDDPAGQNIDTVRRIRDEIRRRVEDLMAELT
jgi:arsenite methyltransferase